MRNMPKSRHGILHAVDRAPAPGQKRVTAVCGDRVYPDRTIEGCMANCIGCRAILLEREREFRARLRADTRDVVQALELMMRLRTECVYHGRGWHLLNAACCRLAERFWKDWGHYAFPGTKARES